MRSSYLISLLFIDAIGLYILQNIIFPTSRPGREHGWHKDRFASVISIAINITEITGVESLLFMLL